MKTRLLGVLLSWLILLVFGAQAQTNTVLALETFEDSPSGYGYTASPAITNGGPYQYFKRQAFDTPGSPTSTYPDAEQAISTGSSATIASLYGSYLWTGEGVRGAIGTSTARSAGVVTLRSVATTGYKNLRMVVAFASARPSGTTYNDVLTTDRIRLQYSFNNGTTWTTAGMLLGNKTGGLGRFQQDTSPLDSIPDTNGTIIDNTLRDITANISSTGANLLVRVVADTRNPSFVFDNIRVIGDVDNTPKPTLTGLETTTLPYTEGGNPVSVTSALAVGYSDNSATNITGATVSVSNFVNGQDQLNVTLLSPITGSYNTSTGVLTLSGTTTQANYQTVLRSITYSNGNTTTLPNGTRQLTFQVTGGGQVSSSPVRLLAITQTLNAPALLNYTENFDSDGEGQRYAGDVFYGSLGPVGFFRSTTNPAAYNGSTVSKVTYTNTSGGFWYGEGTITQANPKAPFSSLQLAPVNATGRINIRFTVAIGAGGTWRSYYDANNVGDWFELFYSTDGGTTLTKFGAFYGAPNESLPRQDADLHPTTTATGTPLSSALQDFTFNLPSSVAVGNLTFVLRLRANGDTEIAFDNIRITAATPPAVTTAAPTSITGSSAALGGQVTDDGGSPVTARGVVYSTTNTTPTIGAADVTQDSNSTTGTGAFSETIGGLAAATTYYVRAYATNALGTTYGAVQTFSTQTTVVSIVRASPNPTNSAAVSYTVTFGASVSGLTASNFSLTTSGLARSQLGAVTGSGATYSVLVYPGSGDGTLVLNLANATGISPGISTPLPFAGETYTIDHTAPTLTSVGVPANGTYGIGTSLLFTVNFSEAVVVNTTGGTPSIGLTVGSATRAATYVAGSGTTALQFRYTVVSGDQAPNGVALAAYISLNGGTIQDLATNTAPVTFSNVPSTSGVLVDGVAPTVTAFSGPVASGGTTATSPFTFSVSFSKSVTNFLASGITVTNGSVTSGPTGSGTGPYTFSVTPTTAGTATTVTIATGAAKDAAGNGNTASSTYSLTYLPPTAVVSAVTGITPSPTATAQVSYAVTFSSAVSGLTTGNFNLTTSGSVSGASVASVSPGPGTTYTVVVNTGTGDGTLRLNLNNSTGVTPTVTGLPYTSGTVYTLTKSFAAAPTLRIQAAGSASGNSDVTAFVDVVQVLSGGTAFANGLQNGSFESNNVPASDFKKTANGVVAAPWSFTGTSGVARYGSGFDSQVPGHPQPLPPNGDAVALIQSAGDNNASISQNLAVPTGSYQVSFQTAQRYYTSVDQRLNVFLNDGLNNVFIGAIQPNNIPTYDTFTSATFNVFAPALTATVSTTSASPTNTAPLPFAVSFSQSVGTTFTASDVTVTGGTLNTTSFSGSGAGPYTFTVTPSGFGIVTVSVAGGVAFDANNTGNTASTPVSVQFQAPTLAVGPATLPVGTYGVAYSQTLTTSGGTAPYTYAITTGALPAGLTLSSAGVLSGTPTGGTATFTVTVTDASAAPGPYSGARSYTLTIGYPTITLSPASLPNGTQGTAYSQTISASGGTAPYTYALTAGALPAGLSLNLSNGTLSGTPTASGSFTFTVTATDASAAPGPFSGARTFSLSIGYPDLVISTSGQLVPAGTYHSITVQQGGVGTLAGDVTVTSDVTVQSGGVLNDGCALISGPGKFTLAPGGTLSICSAQGISSSGATGTVQVTGTRSFSTDALYTYNGTVAQVTGTGLPPTVRALTLTNPAGLSLTNALVTTTAATFLSGVLTTGANTLTLGSGATLSEAADGYVTGTVLATRNLATAGSPEAFGGLGLMLTPSGSTLPGSTFVRRVTGTALRGTGGSTSITRYFDIQPTLNTGLNVALVLTARDDERNGIVPANLRLFKSADNGTSWQLQPATVSTATVSGLTTYSASLSGISDFSLWTLGDAAAPLPVTLTSFQALLQEENRALLRWVTASELHSAYFAVERSLDGRTFVEVGRVAAAGTSLLAHSYELRDPQPLTGLTYYRLRQVDTDKSATYSPVVTLVPRTQPAVAITVYPNPRRGMAATSVEVQGLLNQPLTVWVTDMLGRTISSQQVTPTTSQATLPLPLPADLAAGVYSVSVQAGNQVWTRRLTVAP